MEIQEIIARNRAQRVRARELNTRADESIFMVMNREQVERWLSERLAGARRMGEVKNPAVIAFPELDPEMVKLVMGENPDEITIIGRQLRVEYRDGYAPRVTLDSETISAHGWRELPDAGVKLPGGRLVEVVVPFGYYDTISGQDISELKSRCVSKANKSIWDNWPTDNRPAIALPDPIDPTSSVSEIIECQYGISVIDGSSLVAFGVVVIKGYRYYSSDPYFEGKWYQVREEAAKAKAESAAKLESIREEAIKQAQLDNARKAAESAQESLRSVQYREGWYELESDLRSRVESRRYERLPYGLDEFPVWTEGTNALVAEVQAAFIALTEKKVEEKRVQREACDAVDAEDRARFTDLLVHASVLDDLEYARRIDAFVKEAIRMRGPQASRILAAEAEEQYGKVHRAASLERNFPGINHHGMWWSAGGDIVPIAFWAARIAVQKVKQAEASKVDAKPASAEQVTISLDGLKAKFGKKR